MYYLTNICFLCLKNNLRVQSVFTADRDGVVFNEKLRRCFPEIINFPPDAHKLACVECLEKLRMSYDFRQAVIRNNDVFQEYLENLQSEHKSPRQLSVVLAGPTLRKNPPIKRKLPEVKVENYHVEESNNLKLKIINLSRINEEASQPISNENDVLPTVVSCPTEQMIIKTENVETVEPVADIEMVLVKPEQHFSDDDASNFSDEESMEYEEDSEESITHNLNSSIDRSVIQHNEFDTKFCTTCQKQLFKDLNNINLHLNFHIQLSVCTLCEKSVEEIIKYQNHVITHCSTTEPKDNEDNEEKLSCAICKKDLDNIKSLKKHIYTDHMINLDCELCDRSFYSRINFLKHVLLIHCGVKRFECKICNKRLTSKASVRYHTIYMHYSGKVLACKHCKKVFRSPRGLTNHIARVHPKEKMKEDHFDKNKKQSSHIEKIVSTSENLKNVGPVIKTEKDFVKQDGSSFEDVLISDEEELEGDDNLTKNISVGIKMPQEHNSSNSVDLENQIELSIIQPLRPIAESSYCGQTSINPSIICEICQEMQRHLNILIAHLKVHMRESACSLCKESVGIVSELQRHMLVPCEKTNISDHNASNAANNQQDPENIQCAVCLKKFPFNDLRKHMYTHVDSFNCVLCGTVFTDKMNVVRHLLRHCDIKPFRCESCHKSFTTKAALDYHVTYTHLKKVHVCGYCNKTLRSLKTLRTHILKFHPDKTFRCNVCEKVFLYYNKLKNHAKIHAL